jgi:hypothetical protein
MNKILHANKRFISTLFLGVYLFAVVFSGFFHTHTNNFNTDLASIKEAPLSSKIINFGGNDDCFNSHFFNTSVAILDNYHDFSFIAHSFINFKNFTYYFSVPSENILFFSLRAPPSFI